MKLLVHSQTSVVQPFKFGNGQVISSHTSYNRCHYLSTLGLKLNHFSKRGPRSPICNTGMCNGFSPTDGLAKLLTPRIKLQLQNAVIFIKNHLRIWSAKWWSFCLGHNVLSNGGTWPLPWCHQIETYSVLLAICAGNLLVPGEFPAWRTVTRSFDVFFDLRLNNREAGDLRCYRAHYDVIVISTVISLAASAKTLWAHTFSWAILMA